MKRSTAGMVLVDGVLGVVIGASTLARSSAMSPVVTWDRWEMFTNSIIIMALMLGLPMFFATAALAPVLLRFLATQKQLTRARFYFRSALAGICFGVAASAVTGALIGVAVALQPSPDGPFPLAERLAALVGAPMLLGMGAMLTSLFFLPSVVVTGSAFGILNGWYVRAVGLE